MCGVTAWRVLLTNCVSHPGSSASRTTPATSTQERTRHTNTIWLLTQPRQDEENFEARGPRSLAANSSMNRIRLLIYPNSLCECKTTRTQPMLQLLSHTDSARYPQPRSRHLMVIRTGTLSRHAAQNKVSTEL